MLSVDPLDMPLLRISPIDHVSARDLCAGTLCTGMTGSGKSSGPAATLLRAFARSGMGGVLTCAKPGDAETYQRLLADEGRASSVIVWNGANGGFNFLSWILAQQGDNGVGNAIEFLMRVIEMKRLASATPGAAGDQFWIDAVHQMLRHAVPIIHAATGGTVRIEDILHFVRSAPPSAGAMRDPEWQRGSFFFRIFAQAAGQIDDTVGAASIAYWSTDFGGLDAKMRGNLLISLSTILDTLSSGWLGQAFTGQTSLVPELCFSGVTIILDMPALTRHEEGVLAQQIFLYAFQKAVLSRNGLAPYQRERPVFLMVDEFQLFCNSQFADFLSTCRSSRCCTVLLTQSLAAIYARMGDRAHDRTHQLIANCATKIWAANNCTTTNQWAAEMIGKSLQWRANHSRSEGTSRQVSVNTGEGSNWGTNQGSGFSSSYGPDGGGGGSSFNSGSSQGGSEQWGRSRSTGSNSGESWGASEQLDYRLAPDAFGRMLKTGGPAHGNRVSVVWHQSGRIFASGETWLVAEFAQ